MKEYIVQIKKAGGGVYSILVNAENKEDAKKQAGFIYAGDSLAVFERIE